MKLISHIQRFLQIITCMFYGADCSRPFLVPVPVRDRVVRIPTLDDLDITYWVKQYEHRQCTASRRILRRSLESVPCSNVPIGGLYTVFFEIPSSSLRPNRLLLSMSNMIGSRETVTGSVLVVKQRLDRAIVDMSKGDQLVSNFLVSRYVTCNSPLILTLTLITARCTPNLSLLTSPIPSSSLYMYYIYCRMQRDCY